MEHIAIIDLGSNTARMMVMAYYPHHSFKLVDEVREMVRLAEGVGPDGCLRPLPMRRAVESLKMFRAYCQASNIKRIVSVATSAVREATNQEAFLDEVAHEARLELRVLSGEEEAYYGYLGVVNSLSINNGFVIDIGGGSTEVTELYGRSFSRSSSKQIGAVRLTDQYVQSDPISKQDFRVLQKAADDTFAEVDWLRSFPTCVLVGIGGTIRSLARIDQKRHRHPLDRVHGYVLTSKALDSIVTWLRRCDQSEREAIPGLNRDRADVILAGAVILRQLMHRGNFTEIVVSGQGLREGLFYEHFLAGQDSPLFTDIRLFSVQNLAYFYNYEVTHAEKVAALSASLFDQLRTLHSYGAWERELLIYAALLHDIGTQVGYYDHHKHSAYLVLHSALHGFAHREVALLAMLVRLHRKGSVDVASYRAILEDDDEVRVGRLGGILRIAEYLERSKSQVVAGVAVVVEGGSVQIRVQATGDATVEVWAANRRANLFRQWFGCDVEIVLP